MTAPNQPLAKHVQALGSEIKPEVWQSWPRKADAHLIWKLRPRQLDGYVARKRLRLFLCPDQTIRIPKEDMLAVFGEAPPEVAAVTAAKAPAQLDVGLEDIDDPIAMMFREAVNMWKLAAGQIKDLVQLTTQPMNAAITALKDTLVMQQNANDVLAARVAELESARDVTIREREEAIDNRHLRDLMLSAELSKEKRREKITDSFVSQLPIFMAKWTGGTLSDFVTKYSAEEWELLLGTGFVKPEQATLIREILSRQAAVAALAAKKQAEKEAREKATAAEAQPPAPAAQSNSAANGAAATGGN